MESICLIYLIKDSKIYITSDKPVQHFIKMDNQKRELINKDDSSKETKSDYTGREIGCG